VKRESLVEVYDVSKWFEAGPHRSPVLSGVTFFMAPGEFVVVLGPSGSGKSTLLNLVGAIDTPCHGRLVVAGVDLATTSADERVRFRRDKIGFVFQFYNLFPTLTAAENVAAGLEVLDLPRREIALRTRSSLGAVGLADHADAFPAQLSGGQQQRVAIARALAKEPPLVLADEPTGNLDRETAERVVTQMRELARRTGAGFMVVTHNVELAAIADRVVQLVDGRLVEPLATVSADAGAQDA
jgi:putative ABC transport system ATP-binding protein